MKQAIKNHIADRAREIFEKKGFVQTTIEEIARSAGISKPTLYKYFAGKDKLFLGVMQQLSREQYELMQPILNGSQPFPGKLRELVRCIMQHVADNEGIMNIMIHNHKLILQSKKEKKSDGEKQNGISLHDVNRKSYASIRQFFVEGCEQGWIRQGLDTESLAVIFLGMINQIIIHRILKMQEYVQVNAPEDLVVEILTHGIFYKEKISKWKEAIPRTGG